VNEFIDQMLERGYQVTFSRDGNGYLVDISEGEAVTLSAATGPTMGHAAGAAADGLEPGGVPGLPWETDDDGPDPELCPFRLPGTEDFPRGNRCVLDAGHQGDCVDVPEAVTPFLAALKNAEENR
jgi:hypothetical protein